MLKIVVGSVFEEDSKYYLQIFLDEYLYNTMQSKQTLKINRVNYLMIWLMTWLILKILAPDY